MTTTPDASVALKPSEGFWQGLLSDLSRLARSPRELWIIFAVKFLESVAYFIVLNLVVVYLHSDLGLSDIRAGWIFGAWSMVISLLTFGSGFFADSLGIRRAMIAAVGSCIAGRALLAFAPRPGFAILGLFVMTYGVASMIPTMTAAVRRYTQKDTVSFGFSLFYVTMNVGAFVAPIAVSYFRRRFAHPHTFHFAGGAHEMTSSQMVFAIGFFATLLSLGLILTLRDDPEDAVATIHAGPFRDSTHAPPSPPRESVLTIIRTVIFERAFWRFMLFVSLLVLVRLVFQHAHQTWPTYTQREFGATFPYGYYWSINPAMIIVLTPVVTALTRRFSAYTVIVTGAFITAASVFFMALSTTVAASVAFIIALSIGEALWSPRLYEYTATIAPRGREASYMGLSSLPMFLAKFFVGPISGYMLSAWCPADGAHQSRLMWTIIGLSTFVGPVLILGLRKVIEGPARTNPEIGNN